ncbi:MAG TPA: hemolysin family protein [bacterium]
MSVTVLLTAATAALGLILAVGRLDRHLAAVNKIDLQHAAAEHPTLGPLVAALKDPTGLEWGLRSIQLLLLLAVFTTVAHALPSTLGAAWRAAVVLLVLGAAVVLEAWSRRANGKEAVRELPRFARYTAPLWPLLTPVAHGVERLLPKTVADHFPVTYVSREELQCLREIDRFRAEEVDTAEETIIDRIFDLKETEVSQIMVPIVDVIAVSENQTLDEAIQTVNRTRFSRIPVFRHRVYNIVGILHAFDLLPPQSGERRLTDLLHPPLYVPATMTAESLLRLLRERQSHMAVVVDEYGGAAGIVTAEDVIEELVGEITDEHDAENGRSITALEGGGWHVQARATLDELEEATDIVLDSQQSDTVAGFLLEHFRRIPERGEELNLTGLRITIRDVSQRQIIAVDIVPV